MNHKLDAQLREYYRDIKRLIPSDQKKCISDLREQIEAYRAAYPSVGFQDITDQFGRPEEFAREFFATKETSPQNTMMLIKQMTVVAGILLASLLAALLIYHLGTASG